MIDDKVCLVKSDFIEAGHEDVIRKVVGDLNGEVSDDEVRAKRSALIITAVEQIEAGE